MALEKVGVRHAILDQGKDRIVDEDGRDPQIGCQVPISRRSMLRHSALAAAGAVVAGPLLATNSAHARAAAPAPVAGADLQPIDAIGGLLRAMDHYPLVALGERHMLQEMHDMITALLFHPSLPGKINDIVVEFGNSAYQDLADRFILHGLPVAKTDLEQIWRQIGDPAWNAPIYEQFFRSVRAVNWMQPPARRIRVLLGQPPVTMDQVVAHPTDRRLVATFANTPDDYMAALIGRDVLAKGRKALLIAGAGHTMRGIRQDTASLHGLSAASQVLEGHPNVLFSIALYVLFPVPTAKTSDVNVKRKIESALAERRRVAAKFAGWPRPALAHLAGTWLGEERSDLSYRAIPGATRYQDQADAILYLGPSEAMTASQPDQAIYHWGAYPEELSKAAGIAGEGDQLAIGRHWAQLGPSWFGLYGM